MIINQLNNMYRKKNFKILAICFFFVAFAVNLNAQDSPNGIPLEPDDPIVEQTYWNRTGNPLSSITGNKLGSTNTGLSVVKKIILQ